jgi:hypothetical protein
MGTKQSKSDYISQTEAFNLLCANGADPATLAELLETEAKSEAQISDSEGESAIYETREESQPVNIGMLLTHAIGKGLARYYGLLDWLGDHQINIDIEKALIDFGDNRTFSFQLLGTQSEISNTWLWSWANTTSQIPTYLMEAAEMMREHEFGEGVAELTTPQFSTDLVNSLLGSSWIPGTVPFVYHYGDGSLHMLIEGLPSSIGEICSMPRISTIIHDIIANPIVEHLWAIDSFLWSEGFRQEPTDLGTLYKCHDGSAVQIGYNKETGTIRFRLTES